MGAWGCHLLPGSASAGDLGLAPCPQGPPESLLLSLVPGVSPLPSWCPCSLGCVAGVCLVTVGVLGPSGVPGPRDVPATHLSPDWELLSGSLSAQHLGPAPWVLMSPCHVPAPLCPKGWDLHPRDPVSLGPTGPFPGIPSVTGDPIGPRGPRQSLGSPLVPVESSVPGALAGGAGAGSGAACSRSSRTPGSTC